MRAIAPSRNLGDFDESAFIHWARRVTHCGHSDTRGTAVAELYCGDLSDSYGFARPIRHGGHPPKIVFGAGVLIRTIAHQGAAAMMFRFVQLRGPASERDC